MFLRRTAVASSRPISLADARMHLKDPPEGEDPLIDRLIRVSCDIVGEMSGRVLALETWEAAYPSVSGDLVLPKNPVQAVTGIAYYDALDALQSAVLSDFYIFKDDDRCLIRPKSGKSWPQTITREDAITVTFTAGYSAVPDALISAIQLMIGHLYENREAVVTGTITSELPLAVQEMIAIHRIGWAAG
jgi:uncharacterized phiE125 gp8 family phage protein